MAASLPRLLPCGDAALAVEFGATIDPASNARVLALDARAAEIPGVVETVPTYRSLLVHYDPLVIGFDALGARLLGLCASLDDLRPGEGSVEGGRTWRVPVAYGGRFGIDLDDVAARHGLSSHGLIDRHAAPLYQVAMIGFMPGLAYLAGLDATIATPRRETPRLETPAGSISIGGVQGLIASIPAPSGWHLLGRTPVRTYDPRRDPPFLLAAGDWVRFEPIDPDRFAALDRAAEAGDVVADPIG